MEEMLATAVTAVTAGPAVMVATAETVESGAMVQTVTQRSPLQAMVAMVVQAATADSEAKVAWVVLPVLVEMLVMEL
jgi:predicted LPLAT superfamily acyltransferase